MKEKFRKVCNACLKLIPICAAFVVSLSVNSTGSWIHGQEELPQNSKKYRKF